MDKSLLYTFDNNFHFHPNEDFLVVGGLASMFHHFSVFVAWRYFIINIKETVPDLKESYRIFYCDFYSDIGNSKGKICDNINSFFPAKAERHDHGT